MQAARKLGLWAFAERRDNQYKERNSMTSEITTMIRHAIGASPEPQDADVHFHIDSNGRAYVCDFDRCDSPALSLREASLTADGPLRRAA